MALIFWNPVFRDSGKSFALKPFSWYPLSRFRFSLNITLQLCRQIWKSTGNLRKLRDFVIFCVFFFFSEPKYQFIIFFQHFPCFNRKWNNYCVTSLQSLSNNMIYFPWSKIVTCLHKLVFQIKLWLKLLNIPSVEGARKIKKGSKIYIYKMHKYFPMTFYRYISFRFRIENLKPTPR